MFSESSTRIWAILQLPCCSSKQGELSENTLQNLPHKLLQQKLVINLMDHPVLSVVSPAVSPFAAHSPYSHVTLDDHNRFVMAPGTANAGGGGGGVDPLDVKPVIGNQQQQADYQRMMQHAANMGMAVPLSSIYVHVLVVF